MKYYILNTISNSMSVCETLQDLIKWFAYSNHKFYFSEKRTNRAFEDVAMNYNDKHPVYYVGEEEIHSKKSIMVFDSYNRIIDPRDFKDQILNYKFESSKWSYRCYDNKYEFRKDPVPGIHKNRRHRGSYLRHPKTTQERRLSCDNEIKEYIKPSRNMMNLPNVYDDIWRNRDHSWKAKKLEKQWMKNK